MTAQEVYKRLMHFIDNDFAHLSVKVEGQSKMMMRFFITLIAGLIGMLGGLFYVIVRLVTN